MTFTNIAKTLGVSPQYISQIANCDKRPNWKRAKQLAEITSTTPELWLDGTKEEIIAALAEENKPSRISGFCVSKS